MRSCCFYGIGRLGKGERLVEGFTRHVCVRLGVLTKEPWPGWIREAVQPYVQEFAP